MRSDMRGLTVSGRGSSSIPAAGYTGNAALTTGWIDVSKIVGVPTFRGVVASHASISGTLSIQHATSAAGAGSETVTEDDHFPGGRATQGANATGGVDYAAGTALDAALSYNGPRRFVRGVLTVANATGGAITTEATVVGVAMPQVEPAN